MTDGNSLGRSTIGGAEGGWWARERAQFIADRLRGHGVHGGRAIDVGCGRGELAPFLAGELAAFVVGCDGWLSPGWANEPGRCAYVVGDARALPFRTASADLVTAFDVIEHFEDDRVPLSAMATIVGDAGLVCVTVPAGPRLWSPFDDEVGHFRRYEAAGLAAACERTALRPVDVTHYFAWLVPPAWLLRRRTRHDVDDVDGGALSTVVDRVVAVVGRMERWVLRRWRLPIGTSLWALCRPIPPRQ